jgi:hypothetical protein
VLQYRLHFVSVVCRTLRASQSVSLLVLINNYSVFMYATRNNKNNAIYQLILNKLPSFLNISLKPTPNRPPKIDSIWQNSLISDVSCCMHRFKKFLCQSATRIYL